MKVKELKKLLGFLNREAEVKKDYTYNPDTGALTINGEKIKGDINTLITKASKIKLRNEESLILVTNKKRLKTGGTKL